jgi:hypothetical protein
MPYMILRGSWYDIVLNAHAPTEDEIDGIKDSFYEELNLVFDKFPKYRMKILLGDVNTKVGREYIFEPIISNESLHEIIKHNEARVVTLIRLIGHLLMGRRTTKLTIL